jgi:hypothetical protein
MPTIAVSAEVKKKLNSIKNVEDFRSENEILENYIISYEKTNFLKASKLFQEKLKENQLKITDLCESNDFKVLFLGE